MMMSPRDIVLLIILSEVSSLNTYMEMSGGYKSILLPPIDVIQLLTFV